MLYQQVETLLRAETSLIVESNFEPAFADEKWQALYEKHDFELIQIRCETAPEILLTRYVGRIESGERHEGHVDASHDPNFLEAIQRPMGWVNVASTKFSFDSTNHDRTKKESLFEHLIKELKTDG